jgi:hypothetical protein
MFLASGVTPKARFVRPGFLWMLGVLGLALSGCGDSGAGTG